MASKKSSPADIADKEKKTFEKDVREMFELFDKNGDDSISHDEFDKVLRALGYNMTQKEVRAAVKKIDSNRNGKIEFGEFRHFMMQQQKRSRNDPDSEKEIRQAFRLFDRDGNGYIDKRELQRAMTTLGEALTETELNIMMRDADKNGDGKIDYNEFVKLWKQKPC